MLVVDASVVVELLLRTAAADAIGGRLFGGGGRDSLHAPQLIDVEVTQVLRRYVMRGELSADHGGELVALLQRLPITRHSHGPLLGRMWLLRHNLTAYDAAYVALAEVLRATMVTRDERLGAAPGLGAAIEVI